MKTLKKEITPHYVTSNIDDRWWKKGKEYTVFVNVMSDKRLQLFDHSSASKPNLKIYDGLEPMFNDFNFSEISQGKITENYRFITS